MCIVLVLLGLGFLAISTESYTFAGVSRRRSIAPRKFASVSLPSALALQAKKEGWNPSTAAGAESLVLL